VHRVFQVTMYAICYEYYLRLCCAYIIIIKVRNYDDCDCGNHTRYFIIVIKRIIIDLQVATNGNIKYYI